MPRRGHPPGLFVLFLTEMWERFSFYCMAAVFMFYMTDRSTGHPFLHAHASLINGLYFGTVYFTPFFGGLLADRKWGYRLTILAGAVVMGVGHLLLAVDELLVFFAGLTCLVIGNGLFKPNISTLVGKLYAPGDSRLDNAYTIFYMGINLGALLSVLVAQYVHNHFGYHAAFATAGAGMVVALTVFLSGQRWLVFAPGDAQQPVPEPFVTPQVQHRRHVALLTIFVLVVLFWTAFNQGTNTLPLWAKDNTDRRPPPWLRGASALLDRDQRLSPELFSAVNPLCVLLFSPLMVLLWTRLRSRGWEPSTPAKVGIGMLLTAAAFAVLVGGGWAGGDTPGQRVSMAYLIGAYVVLTLAELCLSPMGLSLVTKLAAPKQRAAWMGGWFVATAIGGYLSGLVGMLWNEWPHSQFFALLVGTSLLAALLLLLAYPRLHAAMPPERAGPAAQTVVQRKVQA